MTATTGSAAVSVLENTSHPALSTRQTTPQGGGWQPWLLLVELVVEVDGAVPLGIRRTGGSRLLAVALDGLVHLG